MTDNLQMGVRTRRLARAVLGCAAICAAAAARADDYVLAAGETDALALAGGTVTNFTSMTVAGSLGITGDGWIKTPTLNLDGGTLTVDGAKASIGSGHANSDTPTTLTVTNAADGVYGKVIARNGTYTGPIKDNRHNFAAKYFKIATNAADVAGTDGFVDVLSIENACVAIRRFENYSSLTGRITVTGTGWLSKGGGYSYGEGIFVRGPAVIDLQDGAQLTVELGNQLGAFNENGIPVSVTGTGNIIFRHQFNKSNPHYPMFRKGAVLNNSGTLSFTGAWGSGFFEFQDSNVIGPNITQICPVGSDDIALSVPTPVTLAVPNVDFVRSGRHDMLVGTGAIRIDASTAARTFRAHMPITYSRMISNVTSTYENSLTIEKTGSYEATISSTTNIPTLNVLEGVVRITSDCVISNLFGAAGATLIADGCVVSVTGEARLKGLALETANGGTFVKAGAGRTAAYDPGTISGGLHVASGSMVFSKYGFAQKYWRWTFTKVYNGPAPAHFGRFWIFDTDGGHAAAGLAYKEPGQALTAGTCRWKFDPSTNIAIAATTAYWQGPSYVRANFRTDFFSSLNNFANLISPVIDPENPASHLALELRLADAALPVTGYNIMAVLPNDYPTSWTVEASDHGAAWTTVETRTDVTHAHPSGNYYFFDGEAGYLTTGNSPVQVRGKPLEFFHFDGYRNDGLSALAEPLSVQVDRDATLDLRAFTDGQPINRIAIDLSAGGGTIYGGMAAANGTLALTNVIASGFNLSDALPLTTDGFGETANLKTWAVVVDGAPSKYKVTCSGGQLALVPPGVCIIFR